MTERTEIIARFIEKGILVSDDFVSAVPEGFDFDSFYAKLSKKFDMDELTTINSDFISLFNEEKKKEKPEGGKKEIFPNKIEIIKSYSMKPEGIVLQDFVTHLNLRYKSIESVLRQRAELGNVMSIARVLSKKDRENVSIVGMVNEVIQTNKGNYILKLEDPTGIINVIISQTKPDLMEIVKNIVQDEVVGVVGKNSEEIIFAANIIMPDIPLGKELKKAPDETYAIFLSDIHVGSKNFLESEFLRFLSWLQGNEGNEEHKAIAKKIKYLFIVGDLVDGVGIYPGQEEELKIKDIYEQYRKCAQLISQIPKEISVIICPGNHDAGRMSEPQPPIPMDFAKDFYAIENVTMVSNPAIINMHKSDTFPGFDVLLYHGYSFDFYVANVDEIRNKGGYDRADLIMKFLLKRRHLAPTHSSTLYMPFKDEDPLFIGRIPDFFVTGHIHKVSVSRYRNVELICGSCWQSTTAFQEKVGHKPEPGRVPLINLNTREVKIIRF